MNATYNGNNSVQQQWIKAIGYSLLIALFMYFLLSNPAFAQSGGIQTRVDTTATSFKNILNAIGGALLAAAFLYVGYGMAFNGKQWKDVANVCYGCLVAGMGTLIVNWLFLNQ